MADDAFLRYSHRTATQRTGGRYDLHELWQVPNIDNTGGGEDDPSDSWQHEVLNANDLPQLGDYSRDGGYICTSVVCRSLDDQGTADVDVTWQEDPLTLVSEVNYFGQSKPKPAWQGIAQQYGGPDNTAAPTTPPTTDYLFDFDSIEDIRNTADDRYNPPVQYDVPLERIEVMFRCSLKWHDTGVSAGGGGGSSPFTGNWDDYLKHWNETDFVMTQTDPDNSDNSSTRTFPAGTLMLFDKRAPLVKEPYFHRCITLIFLYDPDMWCSRLPDMGPRCRKYLATVNGHIVQIEPPGYPTARVAVTDTMGRPFGGSAELDGHGNQMIPDSSGKMPSANIFMWWPVDDNGDLLKAEFDDLEAFTPERSLNV